MESPSESPRDEFDRSWQPRLWITLGVLILIGAYLIAFVVGNDEEASVNFVFAEGEHVVDLGHPPLAARGSRRRRAALAAAPPPSDAQERSERRDARVDLGRRRVAVGQPRGLLAAAVREEVRAFDEGDSGGLGTREQPLRIDG